MSLGFSGDAEHIFDEHALIEGDGRHLKSRTAWYRFRNRVGAPEFVEETLCFGSDEVGGVQPPEQASPIPLSDFLFFIIGNICQRNDCMFNLFTLLEREQRE